MGACVGRMLLMYPQGLSTILPDATVVPGNHIKTTQRHEHVVETLPIATHQPISSWKRKWLVQICSTKQEDPGLHCNRDVIP